MDKKEFIEALQKHIAGLASAIQSADGAWVVKGFIDVYRDVYTISSDTKVISKIAELYVFPHLQRFATENGLRLELTKEQNFYPDMTFIDKEGNKYAVDVKTSYRTNRKNVNGMTLGSFTGYFRNRASTKNVTYPYRDYKAHIVLGIVYSIVDGIDLETKVFKFEDLDIIKSVVRDFQFFVQEKWRIATDRPGSGNTKNIGSINSILGLVNGQGPFAELGEDVFDDYWTHYLTRDMAAKAELDKPYYRNLEEYKKFKGIA